MPEPQRRDEMILHGIPASGGVCQGKILVLGKPHAPVTRRALTEAEVAAEIRRLEEALVATRQEIREVQHQVSTRLGPTESSIFDAHLLVLDDPVLLEEIVRTLREEKVNAEYAFHTVATRYSEALAQVEDDYLRERAADLRDVMARVLNSLTGYKHDTDLRRLKEPCLLVAHDLSASTTAQLDKRVVLGFATDIGGTTSHTAIMARSLGIPAVVGLQNASQQLESGVEALLDGYHGLLIIHPAEQTLVQYGQLAKQKASLAEKLRRVLRQPAVTRDGAHVTLSANIEHASDVEAVQASGAEGVGLFRTEFLFINRVTLPDEEEQYQTYRQVAAALHPQPVVIRTLDLGGDKFASHLQVAPEINPFLGWRAIRFCLQQPELFRTQLRAILRASAEGNVKLMYPMISGLDELNQANALVEKYKAELRAENIPFNEHLEIGAMIETPSAALVTDALAKRVHFFSIGSNDLIQYTLAADRTNERVAHLYEPTHPSILRLIKLTVEAGHKNHIWVGVCGEMAGDPVLVPLLLGLGVDELSAASSLVPPIKFLIRQLRIKDARTLAEFALQCESATEILARAQTLAQSVAPDLFEIQV